MSFEIYIDEEVKRRECSFSECIQYIAELNTKDSVEPSASNSLYIREHGFLEIKDTETNEFIDLYDVIYILITKYNQKIDLIEYRNLMLEIIKEYEENNNYKLLEVCKVELSDIDNLIERVKNG